MPIAKRTQSRAPTGRAREVAQRAKKSVHHFYSALDAIRSRSKRGALTDEEQDLLRAALVFAGAGLDSAVKYLVRDCVRELAGSDPGVTEKLEEFVRRKIRSEPEGPGEIAGAKFLSKVLVSTSPQSRLIEEYVLELTGESLQSKEQVATAAGALGVSTPELGVDLSELHDAFLVRNVIVHELDVNLEKTQARRSRNSRRRQEMEGLASRLLDVTENLIAAVEAKLEHNA